MELQFKMKKRMTWRLFKIKLILRTNRFNCNPKRRLEREQSIVWKSNTQSVTVAPLLSIVKKVVNKNLATNYIDILQIIFDQMWNECGKWMVRLSDYNKVHQKFNRIQVCGWTRIKNRYNDDKFEKKTYKFSFNFQSAMLWMHLAWNDIVAVECYLVMLILLKNYSIMLL